MTLDTQKIKGLIAQRGETIESVARRISNREYVVNTDSLSKVINGKRSTQIIRVRFAKFLGLPVEEIFGN